MNVQGRMIVGVVAAVAAFAGFWFGVLAPKRSETSAAQAQLAQAQSRLDVASAQLQQAEGAKARYERDYATVARLGKAVPTKTDVASLVYQLETAARAAKVDFHSISVDDSAAAAQAQAAPATPSKGEGKGAQPSQSSAGISPKPFSFTFRGKFLELRRLLAEIGRFSRVKGTKVTVSGRLLTIDSVALNPAPAGLPTVTAQVTANAYIAPLPTALPGASPQASTGAPPPTTTTSSQVAP